VNQYQLARQKAKKEEPKKALEALFDQPPKPKGVPMANKLDDLQEQIESLQKQRNELLAKERSSVIEDINAKIRTFGFSPKDLSFGEPVKTTPTGRAKVAMKYRLDNNVWSGRGRKPKWVEAFVANGGKLDDILIK
jgi:DNA-binding protein H-NS